MFYVACIRVRSDLYIVPKKLLEAFKAVKISDGESTRHR